MHNRLLSVYGLRALNTAHVTLSLYTLRHNLIRRFEKQVGIGLRTDEASQRLVRTVLLNHQSNDVSSRLTAICGSGARGAFIL